MKREGFEKLLLLPTEIQERIAAKYGSLEDYYFEIFYLEHEVNKRHKSKAAKNEIDGIRHIQLDFEDELEDWGIEIADEIIYNITTDYSEKLVKRHMEALDKILLSGAANYSTPSHNLIIDSTFHLQE